MTTVGDIAAALQGKLAGGAEVRGDDHLEIKGLAPIETAEPGFVTHLSSRAYRRFLAATRASAVLLRGEDAERCPTTAIVVANPYLAFAHVSQLFAETPQLPAGASSAAIIDPAAEVHPTAAVAPCAVLAAGAKVGARAQIGAGVFIGEDAVVGEDTVVHANATLYHGVRVGARCEIHSGAVIGADGFGFTPDERGRLQAIAQLGGVVLGDDVVVGACTAVDRGAITDTVVRDGVKMDNHVQIGHNCDIGEHTVICGRVGIAGSTKVGRHCAFGGGAGVCGDQPIEICDHVQVGVVTTVTRSVTKPGVYQGAILHSAANRWRRNALRFNELDALAKRVARLEAQGGSNPGGAS